MSEKLKIQYDVVAIDDVVNYFVRGYQKDKGEITSHEWFIDPAKGKLVIRLYVRVAPAKGREST